MRRMRERDEVRGVFIFDFYADLNRTNGRTDEQQTGEIVYGGERGRERRGRGEGGGVNRAGDR